MNSTFDQAMTLLSQLQNDLASRRNSVDPNEFFDESERLLFCALDEGLHIEFYGATFGTFFEMFTDMLCAPAVAASASALIFDGPDLGGNGTRDWDLSPLLQSEAHFPRLQTLEITPSPPDFHNQTTLGEGYEENGQIARLLARAPDLEELTVPSAPDASFFQIDSHPLQSLRVEAGHDTQNFILNLSQSSNFGQLYVLDFGDYNQTYMENYQDDCTPFEHYEQLFRSPAFASARLFTLRNSLLSQSQLQQLARLKSDCSIRAVQCSGDYVRA